MMYRKKRGKIFLGLLISVLILCLGGCAGSPEELEGVTEIVIPASYLQFVGADAEDTAESYREHCTDSEVRDTSVVLDVTDRQKNDIIQMNQEFIDKVLDEFQNKNPAYSYELADDYSSIVYTYDENLDSFLQAELLMGITSMYALNGIIENNTTEWNVKVTIENCHTGKTVAHGELPEDTVSFGKSEWIKSYE